MTHVNAFYADVEEKKQAVVRAQGELDAAEMALKAHPDYVSQEVTPVETKQVEVTPTVFKKK